MSRGLPTHRCEGEVGVSWLHGLMPGYGLLLQERRWHHDALRGLDCAQCRRP